MKPRVGPDEGWCLHLGLPKAASTLLQKHLFGRHPDLVYLGKLQGGWVSAEVEEFVGRITAGEGMDDGLAATMRERYVLPAISQGRTPALSNEGLTVGLVELHERRARFLKQVWSPCLVLFVIRHPLKLVESLYFHRLRQYAHKDSASDLRQFLDGRPYFSVEQWLEANLCAELGVFNLLDYAQTIQAYCRVLGRDSVGVFVFEELTRELEATLHRVCAHVGIRAMQGTVRAPSRRVNPRWTGEQVRRLQQISASRWRTALFRAAGRKRRDRMLALGQPGTRARVDWSGSSWVERIEKQTARGNRWLAETFGLPLHRYHYPM